MGRLIDFIDCPRQHRSAGAAPGRAAHFAISFVQSANCMVRKLEADLGITFFPPVNRLATVHRAGSIER
jgi:hypothetical protein